MFYIKEIDNTGRILIYTVNKSFAEMKGYSIALDESEVEKSDIDGYMYVKGSAPMKSDEDKLNDAKDNKQKEVNTLVTETIEQGFWYRDKSFMKEQLHFSFEVIDQTNFNSAMNAVTLKGIAGEGDNLMPEEISWNGYKDLAHTILVPTTFNTTTFANFWLFAEIYHKNAIIAKGRIVKDKITAATTIEEVENIEVKL